MRKSTIKLKAARRLNLLWTLDGISLWQQNCAKNFLNPNWAASARIRRFSADCRSFQPFHYRFPDSVNHWVCSILRRRCTFVELPVPVDALSLFQVEMLCGSKFEKKYLWLAHLHGQIGTWWLRKQKRKRRWIIDKVSRDGERKWNHDNRRSVKKINERTKNEITIFSRPSRKKETIVSHQHHTQPTYTLYLCQMAEFFLQNPIPLKFTRNFSTKLFIM